MNCSIMKRKQNIFLFFDDRDSQDMDLKLVRLYMNKFIIDEDEQSEIQAVVPLVKHLLSNCEEKEESDQDAVYEQLEKLGYKYFIEESYVTHFIILPGFPISWSISLWIDYWFNELVVEHQDATVDYNYRFVCTSLLGSKGEICTKEEAKVAYQDYYKRWDSTNRPYKLGSNPISINADNSIPVGNEVEEFKQAITAELLPKPLETWRHNFHETSDNKKFFFYKSLTDSEVKEMNQNDLDKCRNLGIKPELDTIFRRFSGGRISYIISPRQRRCKGCNCKKQFDQRVAWLGKEPIARPGRKGTTRYLCEEDTYPFIIKGEYQVAYEKYMKSLLG